MNRIVYIHDPRGAYEEDAEDASFFFSLDEMVDAGRYNKDKGGPYKTTIYFKGGSSLNTPIPFESFTEQMLLYLKQQWIGV